MKRLVAVNLEALARFLKYDAEMGLSEQGSIKDYFEGLGGYEALENL